MKYNQKTGSLYTDENKLIAVGYSGNGLGKNNPEMEDLKNVGPIPKGRYFLQSKHDSDKTGPFTIVLIPNQNNIMYNRSGFAIHGDSIENPGTASHGCIILSRVIREKIWSSNDKYLEVI